MNVVKPINTAHQLKVIPRFYPMGLLIFSLYNEETKINEVIENLYIIENGYLILSFNYTFIEGQKFQIEIKENENVVYRGKLMATSQNTQNYKASNELYYYE